MEEILNILALLMINLYHTMRLMLVNIMLFHDLTTVMKFESELNIRSYAILQAKVYYMYLEDW